jgi:hypothetical protein
MNRVSAATVPPCPVVRPAGQAEGDCECRIGFENVVVQYRRLAQAHGAAALAEVDGSTCSSCYVSLPQQMVMQVRDGQALFCKTCGRLLYMAAAK